MKRSFLLVLFLAAFFAGHSQVLEPVKWSFETQEVGDQEYDLVFTAHIDKGWTIYSQHTSDNGPIPTFFEFDPGDHYERVGEVLEKGKKKEGPDPLFDNVVVIKFVEGPVVFTQRVKVQDPGQPVTGYLTFMTCDHERCLPPTDVDFAFSIPAAESRPQTEAQASASEQKTSPPEALSESAESDVEEAKQHPGVAAGMEAAGFEPLQPVNWTFSHQELEAGRYALTFTAHIDDGWTIYSQHTSPEDGPVPTGFTFTPADHYSLEGPVKEEGKLKEGMDPFFGVRVAKFVEGPVVFTQEVQVADPGRPIEGYLTFMCCDDEQCLPPTDVEFSFALTQEAAVSGPVVHVLDGDQIDQARPAIRETYKSPIGDCGEEEVARDKSIIWTFILGFLGGLVALLTPCVFPMIPLTVSFFTKSSKDRATGIRNALLYGLSIIVIYVAIGLFITAAFGATALNELSTNWIANTLFFVIFVFFAFSFFGYYELTLPSSWSNKTDRMADKGGLIGIFFMAFTLAIVSFSCTGPIIGSAIVESATSKVGPFVVMLGFSTALALPFALFAAFPGWLNTLPKSGGWMNSVKVVLGFLELALALKFLSVADMTMHWGILPYELFMGLWVLIFAALTAYLFGWIRFPHDSPVRKLTLTRGLFSLLFLGLTIYLVTGFMVNEKTRTYNSLGLMSGLAPPAHYNLFLPTAEPDQDIKARYSSYSKCANNLDCFKDYYEGLEYAREVGKPVLLDFTGFGCVNCRKTEEHIWVVDKVWKKIQNDFVLISLYVDDRKPLENVLVSKTRNTKLRNVGNKWADFQIVNFEQNSQPLYVMMTPDEKVLAAPRGYKEGVDDYSEFLECGLKTFEDSQVEKLGSNQ